MDDDLDAIYRARFSERESHEKHALWQVLCDYLQRFVDPARVVLDLACDKGYFIENIRAEQRWAADLRDMSSYLSPSVRFVQSDGLKLEDVLPAESFDLVFMSNYLEHLASAEKVVEQFRVARRLLRPGGRVLVLQPNIRLIGSAYWNFIDHSVPLTEKSVAEAAELAGLTTGRVITRFLPFTTKGSLPASPVLLRAYLRFRPAWYLFGRQTLYEAVRQT